MLKSKHIHRALSVSLRWRNTTREIFAVSGRVSMPRRETNSPVAV